MCCVSLVPSCSSNEFDCGNGQCILSSWQCDRQIDCNNGADEESCKALALIC